MKKLLTTLALGLPPPRPHAQAWPSQAGDAAGAVPARRLDRPDRAHPGPKLQESWVAPSSSRTRPAPPAPSAPGRQARAAPDGHTLLVSSLGPFVIAPHLIKTVPYDALKDLDPITVVVQAPNVLVVPARPAQVAGRRDGPPEGQPGKMSFASSGNGSSDHLTAELFWQQTGTSGLHVPTRAAAR
jgi:hypothetical protein